MNFHFAFGHFATIPSFMVHQTKSLTRRCSERPSAVADLIRSAIMKCLPSLLFFFFVSLTASLAEDSANNIAIKIINQDVVVVAHNPTNKTEEEAIKTAELNSR